MDSFRPHLAPEHPTQETRALSPEETAIRARRKLTNKFIAAHQAERLRPFLAGDIKLISGEGGLLMGADAVIDAFAGQFKDPDFITYVRTTTAVEVDARGERAAEQGHWTAQWRNQGAGAEMAGGYLAVWRKIRGQWSLESELYITLT